METSASESAKRESQRVSTITPEEIDRALFKKGRDPEETGFSAGLPGGGRGNDASVPDENSKVGNNNRTYLIDDDEDSDAGLEDEESWVEEEYLDEDSDPSLEDDFMISGNEPDLSLLEDDTDLDED